MSKDTIGWIDADRMKASIAALRALRKKPVPAPATAPSGRTPTTNMDSLFVDEEVPPRSQATRSEMRPITDVSKRAYAEAHAVTSLGPSDEVEDNELYLRETQDIQAFPQHAIARTPVREPKRDENVAPIPPADVDFAPKAPAVPFDIKHEVTDRIELGDPGEGEEVHVDKSLAQALDLLKNASNTSYELVEGEEYYDISSAFTQLQTPIHSPAAPARKPEAEVPETRVANSPAANHSRDTMELDPFAALDEIDRMADERESEAQSSEYELDEFGIPITSTRKDFATGAFDSVDRAAVLQWEKRHKASDPFERLDGRVGGDRESSIRRSLEAVTAETPTVAVDEDDDPFNALPPQRPEPSAPKHLRDSESKSELHHLPTANVPTLDSGVDEDSFEAIAAHHEPAAPEVSPARTLVENSPAIASVPPQVPVFDPFANFDEELEADAAAKRNVAATAKSEAFSAFAPETTAHGADDTPEAHELQAEIAPEVTADALSAPEEQAGASVDSGASNAKNEDATAEVEPLGAADFSPNVGPDNQDHFNAFDSASAETASVEAAKVDSLGELSHASPFEALGAPESDNGAVSEPDTETVPTRLSTEEAASLEAGVDDSIQETFGSFAALDASAEEVVQRDAGDPETLAEIASPSTADASDGSDEPATGEGAESSNSAALPFEAVESDADRQDSSPSMRNLESSTSAPSETESFKASNESASTESEQIAETLEEATEPAQSQVSAQSDPQFADSEEAPVTEATEAAQAPKSEPPYAREDSNEQGASEPWSNPPAATTSLSALNWLRHTADWIQTLHPSYNVFVADADGLSLLSKGVDEDTIALAVATRNAIVGTRQVIGERSEGQLSYTVAENTFCHLVWKLSDYGVLTIGILGDHALPAAAFRPLQLEFSQAIDTLPLG